MRLDQRVEQLACVSTRDLTAKMKQVKSLSPTSSFTASSLFNVHQKVLCIHPRVQVLAIVYASIRDSKRKTQIIRSLSIPFSSAVLLLPPSSSLNRPTNIL